MAEQDIRVYTYATSGGELIRHLQPTLPYSLPLYRCLRFKATSPTSSVLSTFDAAADVPPRCFAVAYLNRARRPDTEMWIYVSGEQPGKCAQGSENSVCPDCRANVLALFRKVGTLPRPDMAYADTTWDLESKQRFEASTANPGIIIVGSIHTLPATIICEAKVLQDGWPDMKDEYYKYLLPIDKLPVDDQLPEEFEWGRIRKQDFPLVRSRTPYIRKDATLREMPSTVIFRRRQKGGGDLSLEPVAWAPLKPDGSMGLHVEADYRGQGFAKKVAAKLFLEELIPSFEGIKEDAQIYGLADVSIDNGPSNGVCRSLGGKTLWSVYWLMVDLDKVKAL